MNNQHTRRMFDDRAFTLLEILFVLLIVGFLAVVSLDRWDELVERHQSMAVFAAVAELNAREKMIWAKTMVAKESWENDAALFTQLDTDLGRDYHWTGRGPSSNGGRIVFQDRFSKDLGRTPSTSQTPGRWSIHEP